MYAAYKNDKGRGDFYSAHDILDFTRGAALEKPEKKAKCSSQKGFTKMYTEGDLVLVNYGTGGMKYSGEFEGKVTLVGQRSLHVFFPDSNTECSMSLNQQHLVKKKLPVIVSKKQKRPRATAS